MIIFFFPKYRPTPAGNHTSLLWLVCFNSVKKGFTFFICFTTEIKLMLNEEVPTKIQLRQLCTQHLRKIPSWLHFVHDKAIIVIIMESKPYFNRLNTYFYVPSFILTWICVGITSEPQVFPFCKYDYHHLFLLSAFLPVIHSVGCSDGLL